MKKNIFLSVLTMLTVLSFSCRAQLVKSAKNISLIPGNQSSYIDKPLSVLLADIKPEIRLFFTERNDDSNGIISFYFVDHTKFVELSKKNVKITRMIVYVTGAMVENNFTLPLEQRFDWTSEYKRKNADLVVKKIIVRVGDE